MRARAIIVVLLLLPLVTASGARAQSESEAGREADMFGEAPPAVSGDRAQSESEAGREADMFGEAPPAASTATTTRTSTRGEGRGAGEVGPGRSGGEASREAELFAAPERPGDSRDLEARLGEANDILDLGAFFYLRGQYSILEHGRLGDFALSSPNFLDVYIDGRPSDRVRAYAQGRLYYDPTLSGVELTRAQAFLRGNSKDLRVLLDQLWLKLDVLRTAFVTVGRQRIKWGSGRAWNPTDFMNQNVRDPLAIFDERVGVDLVKVHFPVESLGWNFYGLGAYSGAGTPRTVGGALRAEIVEGPAELALSAAVRKDRPLRLGADLSAGVGLFDVHAELALSHGVRTPFYTGVFDTSALAAVSYSREDDWIPQLVAGAEVSLRYSDQDSVILGAEYFYNGLGYRTSSLPSLLYPILILNNGFTPFYVGRHYASAYAFLANPGDWNNTSFTLSGISNLSDRSLVVRLDYQVLLLTYLRFNAFGMVHGGRSGGELKLSFDDDTLPEDLRALLRLTPGLEGGLEIVAPLFEVGVGLSIEI